VYHATCTSTGLHILDADERYSAPKQAQGIGKSTLPKHASSTCIA
jgi:hypothetical protein